MRSNLVTEINKLREKITELNKKVKELKLEMKIKRDELNEEINNKCVMLEKILQFPKFYGTSSSLGIVSFCYQTEYLNWNVEYKNEEVIFFNDNIKKNAIYNKTLIYFSKISNISISQYNFK